MMFLSLESERQITLMGPYTHTPIQPPHTHHTHTLRQTLSLVHKIARFFYCLGPSISKPSHQVCTWYTDIHASKTPIHIK